MKIIILFLLFTINLLSENNYFFESKIILRAKNKIENSVWEISVFSTDSILKYKISKELPFDVPPPGISLNEKNGDMILNYSLDGFAEVYKNSGLNNFKIQHFEISKPNYERIILSAFTDNEIILLFSSPEQEKAILKKYKINGILIWEKKLDFQFGYSLFALQSNGLIAFSIYNSFVNKLEAKTIIYNSIGNEIYSDEILAKKINFDLTINAFIFATQNSIKKVELKDLGN